MRYLVDRDEILKEKFSYGYKVKDNNHGSLDTYTTYAVTEESILNAPVVEERKHGHWIECFDVNEDEIFKNCDEQIKIECSCCHEVSKETFYPPFCKICGAIMDEVIE